MEAADGALPGGTGAGAAKVRGAVDAWDPGEGDREGIPLMQGSPSGAGKRCWNDG